ncbi:hypothetical protein ACS0TY_015875 [Phlomoides rotata]
MLHMISCALYSLFAIKWLEIVPFQQIHSRRQVFQDSCFECNFLHISCLWKYLTESLLLSSDGEKLHFMNLLLYMAPMKAMILLPFTLYIEGNVLSATVEKARGDGFMVFLLIRNATVAYLVNLTNFLVTKHTSTLTL